MMSRPPGDAPLWPSLVVLGGALVLAPIGAGLIKAEHALGNVLLGIAVTVAVIGLAMLLAPLLRMPRRVSPERAHAVLAQAASEYGGLTVDGTSATVKRKGYAGRIDFVPGVRPSTDISFSIEGAVDGHLTVTRESLAGQFARQAGISDFEIGQRPFDDIYKVTTSETKTARAVLTREVCETLSVLEKHYPVTLRMTPHSMLLRADGHLYDWRALEPLVLAAFGIFDTLKLPERDTVVIVEHHQQLDDATCEVCGTALVAGRLVRCVKCRTPHHKDCWDFNRKCAVFACGEVKSVG